SQGGVNWARQIGGPGNEQPGDVAIDAKSPDHVYVTGSFGSTLSLQTTLGNYKTLASAGGSDAFAVKYTASTGEVKWTRQMGGTGNDYGNGIGVDGTGNVYLAGSFTGTLKFTLANAAAYVTSKGNSDIIMVKYDPNGALKMFRRLGDAGYDAAAAVGVHDATGDIYLTGGYAPAAHPTTPDVFTAKYNASGILQWNKLAGTAAAADRGQDLVVSDKGAYVTGTFAGSATFGATTLTSSGSADAFLVFYPHLGGGNAAWARKYGSTGWDEGQSVAHSGGNVYLGGVFSGTVGLGSTTLNAKGGAGDQDLFVTRLAWDATPVWAKSIGSTSLDAGRGGIAVDLDNTVRYSGAFGGSVTVKNTTMSGPGVLLTRLDPPTISSLALVNGATDAFVRTLFYSKVPNDPQDDIDCMALGTTQLNFEAKMLNGAAGSVKFTLGGVSKIDNAAPFTWAGDAPKDGGTDYFGATPPEGNQILTAVPYSGPNGTGEAGKSVQVTLTIITRPTVIQLSVVDAIKDYGILVDLQNMKTLTYSHPGNEQLSVWARTFPEVVGSVKFVLDGVARTENAAPYTLAGDAYRADGGIDFKPAVIAPGTHKLKVTAYTGPNATGAASDVKEVTFTIVASSARLGAQPEVEGASAALRVAPNPFQHRTTLSFTATEDGPAAVEVCNAQGLPVARLYEGTLEKGKTYNWSFD
ncbi:MAG TPA: SBBP repeat-containing protein, partial [Cytophagales bacterium]